MIRLVDITLSTVGLMILLPLLLILVFAGYLDTGSPLLRQVRVGRYQKPFILVKLRTMRLDATYVASHLADTAAITPWGGFLRRSKLDELPQLWNVLKGEMSLVGPRPCLLSQMELIKERDLLGVFSVPPGITGLAQINGIDMSNPKLLAKLDDRMLHELNMRTYFAYIIKTVLGAGRGDQIR
jgi:O-antigen biosynthesis protein WbqP